ncbi:MAG: DUF2237 domain-containing protein [Leptospiraceae bacterium]|nr:DUF2237 domain-containing protein [Leptospiraceae bacterium]MDW8307349.1 DUF2237 domain-containing protein [Leptospiraceae bacterium]
MYKGKLTQEKAYLFFDSWAFIAYILNMALNVLGTELLPCSYEPLTGFLRDGSCNSCPEDRGMHLVCAVMTPEFLRFSYEMGNDLITPRPEFMFPGLKPGDRWCVCLSRWLEALENKVAPPVVLESTHVSVLEFVNIETLQEYAYRPEI